MADARIDRLVTNLETSFEATILREEDLAGHDLGLSLLQDRPLTDVVARASGAEVFLPDGSRRRLELVGVDFFLTEGPRRWLLGHSGTIVAECSGPRPARSEVGFLRVLRSLARSRVQVRISTGPRTIEGVLAAANPDHLALEGRAGRAWIPMTETMAIELPEGSLDDL